jgi:hypothetical protein
MISLGLAHFIAKFYLFTYFVVFVFSFINRDENKSNLIILSLALCYCIFGQFSKMFLSFYTYYLGAAFGCLVSITISLFTHLFFKLKHEKSTLFIYGCYFLIAISYLVIHRVRVVIYDTDESIMWFINLQSIFTLTLYFLSICVFAYGTRIRWSFYFGRLSL